MSRNPFENYTTASTAQQNWENDRGREGLDQFTEEMIYSLIGSLEEIASGRIEISPELTTKIDQLEDQIEEEI